MMSGTQLLMMLVIEIDIMIVKNEIRQFMLFVSEIQSLLLVSVIQTYIQHIQTYIQQIQTYIQQIQYRQ